jgi:hypothetical protein
LNRRRVPVALHVPVRSMWCPSASSTAQPVPFHPHPDRRLDSTDGGCGGVPRCSLSQAPSWASSATRDDPRNPTFPRTCRGMTATSPRAPPCPSFFNLLSAKNKIVRGPCWWKSGSKGGRRHNSLLSLLPPFAFYYETSTSTRARIGNAET